MNYICDTGDEKLDAMLRALLERFRDTSAEDGVLLITEDPSATEERHTSVIVLYEDDRYTYSPEHRALTARYGEKYRAVMRPIDLLGFSGILRELHGGAIPVPSSNGEEGSVSYENRTVSFRGRTVKLTAREDELFRLMYEHRGKVVSRERIATAVWGSGTSTNVTDVYMSYLRRKLVTVLGDGVLSSVRGEGYILKMPAGEEIIGTR